MMIKYYYHTITLTYIKTATQTIRATTPDDDVDDNLHPVCVCGVCTGRERNL